MTVTALACFLFVSILAGPAQKGTPEGGHWRTDDGVTCQDLVATSDQILWLSEDRPADLRLRARITMLEGKTWLSAGFLFRAASAADRLLAYVAAGAERKVQVAITEAGRSRYPDFPARAGIPVERDREVELEVRARGALINLLLDGRLLAVLRDAPVRRGRVGLFTFDCRARFRDIVIEPLPAGLELSETVPLLAPLRGRIAPAAQSLDSLIDRTASFALSDQGHGGVTRDDQDRPIPPYLCHAVIRPGNDLSYDWAYNAFHHGLFIEGFLNAYVYSGIEEFRRRAVELADWNLARLTPAEWPYGSLPYSTTTRGRPGGLKDQETIQPDKAAFFGRALLGLARVTGERRFTDAARRIGETLLATQRPEGNWYFRVHPRTAEVLQPYTASIVPQIRLFDELEADGGEGRFAAARDRAFDWLIENPVRTEAWEGYYEDVDPDAHSLDQWMPLEAILYCLEHRDERPGLIAAAQRMEAYVERTFLTYQGDLGPGVREQTACFVPMNAHTLHWALAASRLAEVTGDELLRRAAQSAVNTATWNQAPDGRSESVDVFERGTWRETWYSLAFSPLVLALPYMGDHPDVAPREENHLLRHTAAIREIHYLPWAIEYRTDAPSSDLLVLRDRPCGVTCAGKELPRRAGGPSISPGWSWQEEARVLRIDHPGGQVCLALEPPR